jgi:hypothetical protein
MMIAGDAKGKIAVVDFSADQGEDGTVSLPGADAFGVQGTHVNLESALGTTPIAQCTPNYSGGYCGGFALTGGTELVVQFESNDGQLHRATWATPAVLTRLLVLPPPVYPTT